MCVLCIVVIVILFVLLLLVWFVFVVEIVCVLVQWVWGLEYQCQVDCGDGMFFNLVLVGDYLDFLVFKDGDDYYFMLLLFDVYFGLLIWYLCDLVNWQLLGYVIICNVGVIWVLDIVKYWGCYFIYFLVCIGECCSNFVVWVDDIKGLWSVLIDIGLGGYIDFGYVVGEDGKCYLFFSGGDYVQLVDDGLSVVGMLKYVYDGWCYLQDWDVEVYVQEGLKIYVCDGWYYMIMVVGGIVGLLIGYMVIMVCLCLIYGLWQNVFNNLIMCMQLVVEFWWLCGYVMVIEGIDGCWWMMYYGYENGFWMLGWQVLFELIEWIVDGWFWVNGGDFGQLLCKLVGQVLLFYGMVLLDDFRGSMFGLQWVFFNLVQDEYCWLGFSGNGLVLQGKGSMLCDVLLLIIIVGDWVYQFEVEMEIVFGVVGGVLLFYSDWLYVGVGSNGELFIMYCYGEECFVRLVLGRGGWLWLWVINNCYIVIFYFSIDGYIWQKYLVQMEVFGYYYNVVGRFLVLKLVLYVVGDGVVIFCNFCYCVLD